MSKKKITLVPLLNRIEFEKLLGREAIDTVHGDWTLISSTGSNNIRCSNYTIDNNKKENTSISELNKFIPIYFKIKEYNIPVLVLNGIQQGSFVLCRKGYIAFLISTDNVKILPSLTDLCITFDTEDWNISILPKGAEKKYLKAESIRGTDNGLNVSDASFVFALENIKKHSSNDELTDKYEQTYKAVSSWGSELIFESYVVIGENIELCFCGPEKKEDVSELGLDSLHETNLIKLLINKLYAEEFKAEELY